MTPSLDKIALPACQRATEPPHLLGHVLALIGSPRGGPLSCRVAVGGGGKPCREEELLGQSRPCTEQAKATPARGAPTSSIAQGYT